MKKASLKSKFIFLLTMLIIIIMALVTITNLVRERFGILDALAAKAGTLISVLESPAADMLETGNESGISLMASTVHHDRDVEFTALIASSGLPIFWTPAGSSGEFSNSMRTVFASENLTDKPRQLIISGSSYFDMIRPLETPSGKKGFIVLRLNLGNVKRAISTIIRENLALAAIVLFFGVMMAIFLANVIVDPVAILARGAARISDGDFDTGIEVLRNDEIGELGRIFNNMATRLRENMEREKRLYGQDKLATIGKLAASMAHEIRNPLSTIRAMNQLVADDETQNPRIRRNLSLAIEEVDRVDSVIEQLLRYARPRKAVTAKVNMESIVKRVGSLTKPLAEKKGVSIEVGYLTAPREVIGDEERLVQVVLNLVINSVNACTEGCTITLSGNVGMRGDTKGFVVTVDDDGCGIPEELATSIFEPFVTASMKGTGLGLAISRDIVEAHGGIIWIESKPSRGTCLSFLIPWIAPAELPDSKTPS